MLSFGKIKLEGNKKRDMKNIQKLTEAGWKVIVVWECELRNQNRAERLDKLYFEIVNQ